MLNQSGIEEIKKIIYRFINPGKYSVFIFGSQASNNNRKFSDIDIGIKGNKEIPLSVISEIKEAFEESDIPFSVDVVDFNKVSHRFEKTAGKNTISLN